MQGRVLPSLYKKIILAYMVYLFYKGFRTPAPLYRDNIYYYLFSFSARVPPPRPR